MRHFVVYLPQQVSDDFSHPFGQSGKTVFQIGLYRLPMGWIGQDCKEPLA